MTIQQRYNALVAQKLIKEFKSRNIEGFYCETKEDALKKVLEIIPGGSVVSWGGSVTLKEIGVLDALKNGNYNLLDPKTGHSGAEMDKIAHQALTSDYYLMSANAISITGELVNIDGIGNRVASLIYGPKKVIVIAGMNKIEPNLDSAILRVKNIAAVMGVLNYTQNESTSYEEIIEKAYATCSQLVITSMTPIKDRIKVMLVGESLGF